MPNSEKRLSELKALLLKFEKLPATDDIRSRVLALVPVVDSLRKLGKTVLDSDLKISARSRILMYFQRYPQVVINGKELAVVAGIGEWARRVRELRVQYGWKIFSGVTLKAMFEAESDAGDELKELRGMKPTEYILFDEEQDRESAFRWRLANDIRKGSGGVKGKILEFLRQNIGKEVTGEELSYLAKNKTEWARRVRELRTEEGWPVVTRFSGNPTLPVGVYVLEADRQTPPHDRQIPDPIRCKALRRDNYTCQKCQWTHNLWNRSDPRFLELHHKEHHAKGGGNDLENLITLCNVCHDDLHRRENSVED